MGNRVSDSDAARCPDVTNPRVALSVVSPDRDRKDQGGHLLYGVNVLGLLPTNCD